MKEKLYLCIHGHFYQPPRENPWTGEIELQPSALPFHDWNERIFLECYNPNTEAIIQDLSTGKILELVNNYEYINFNFGPTLLHWMKSKYPGILNRIIDADKKSIEKHHGHGNAIAQVYNHIILPLANRQDNITQIKWGLRDFEFHFSRKSEGIWLAETACNNDTIEYLINENVKYIILAPSQALKIRKFKSEKWEDVSSNNINTKTPYRIFSKMNSEKYIDAFFYDGGLSKAIAFEEIAYSSERLLDRIDSQKIKNYKKPQLVSIAVDGETFGHHKHFADRTIAYLLTKLAPTRGYKIVNYSEYLEMCPPENEVIINIGKNNEGTAWSCAHGVGRWYRDCGCNTSALPGWNQKWRTPLRKALNKLRDDLIIVFETEGKKYFKDVWNARNDFINIILDSSENSKREFIDDNFTKSLGTNETNLAFKLLEIQTLSMLMFTSCGWFFSDISGIETVQILAYAKKAIKMTNEVFNVNLEKDFLKILSEAKSNNPESGTGSEIYNSIQSNLTT